MRALSRIPSDDAKRLEFKLSFYKILQVKALATQRRPGTRMHEEKKFCDLCMNRRLCSDFYNSLNMSH
ncbi:hypothetical protein HanRHA438_Chr00c13g0849651 [Helianthus annuus]|nr:hypothetical protein HanHA300_Chr13g0498541 [Helianthus annuus]KAJ0665189.1 hypothetical protein HanLR1_Chr13g0501251 [Helianthus annuus]KAJ0954546.1 hypothetical protein HanRHA438_Chr00c13g0849651 [Helianthus annuus]